MRVSAAPMETKARQQTMTMTMIAAVLRPMAEIRDMYLGRKKVWWYGEEYPWTECYLRRQRGEGGGKEKVGDTNHPADRRPHEKHAPRNIMIQQLFIISIISYSQYLDGTVPGCHAPMDEFLLRWTAPTAEPAPSPDYIMTSPG